MNLESPSEPPQDLELLARLERFESRIARIEQWLGVLPDPEAALTRSPASGDARPESWEFRIGQFWLAQTGVAVLVVGIAFLLAFPFENMPRAVPVACGYGIVLALLFLSLVLQKRYGQTGRCLMGGVIFLLYFVTLRLHFFAAQPLVTSIAIEWVLLAAAMGANLTIAVHYRSIFFGALCLTLGYATAIIAGQAYALFTIIFLMSGLASYFRVRFRWNLLLVFAIPLSYGAHLIWAIGNPLLGHPLQLVTAPRSSLWFILAYVLIFAAGNLFRKNADGDAEDGTTIFSSLLNSMGGYGLFLFLSLAADGAGGALANLLASGVFLSLAILFWLKEQSKFSTFLYAWMGYAALAVAIVVLGDRIQVLVWLCGQSLLVAATAIWFRSRVTVLVNFLVFVGILFAYMLTTKEIEWGTLSFCVVALLSARLLHWQQHRLDLKTNWMRTIYLVCAVLIFPYALWHLVPGQYVSLSWMAVALCYYLLSVLLHNVKYRWMALATLLLTVLYLILIGTAGSDPTSRVISFIVLGSVLLIISMVYTRIHMQNPRPAKGTEPDSTPPAGPSSTQG